ALALFLSILLGWAAFAVVLLGTAGGLLYCLPAGSRPYAFLGLRALQRFPGSKEVFVGLAWAFTTALVPVLAVRAMPLGWPGLAVAGVFTFTLAFQRALLTDLRDVEGDQLVGRETLGVVLGERSCRILLSAIPPFQALLLFAAGILNWTPPVAYVMLFVAAYGGLSFQLFRRGKLPRAELGEALIDTKFYLCGLLAFLHPVW
ncbi:MAG: UbiA family prenyltransferase, partial [Planctomycetes bacterium]|nr:UbiA family prenyltransferase [Planctomycetota bacterium]